MRLFAAIFLILATVDSVQADLVLDLKYTDGSSMKTVASGDSVFVDLILSDPDGGDLGGGVFLATEGLGTGGGLIAQTSGAAVVTKAGPTSITAGAGFDPTTLVSPVPPTPGVVDSVLLFGPVFPLPLPVGLGMTSITVATFELVVTGAAGDAATLSSDVLDPTGFLIGNETFTTFTDLDALLGSLAAPAAGATFGSVSLMIAPVAVPEPSTILTGLLIAGTLAWRRRKTSAA